MHLRFLVLRQRPVLLFVLLVLVFCGRLPAGERWDQFKEGMREAGGLLSLSGPYAEVSVSERGGLLRVVLLYVKNKMHFSKSLSVVEGSADDAPYGTKGGRFLKGSGYVFVANSRGKVRQVFDRGGNRVSFFDLFRRELEGTQTHLGASGETRIDLTIEHKATDPLDGIQSSPDSGDGSRPGWDEGVVLREDEVLIWYRGDPDDLTSTDDLAEFETESWGGMEGRVVVRKDDPSYLDHIENPHFQEGFLEKNKKYLHKEKLSNYGSVGSQGLYGLEIDGKKFGALQRYRFGPYRVYGVLGNPAKGAPFLAISLETLSEEERSQVKKWGDYLGDAGNWAKDAIGGVFGSN
jgi:hypothetical protein